ncbi:MAG TPA: 2-oxoacid:acceptor oxidoreductase subunit alpha [Thermoanaerobaculia bacterium]|nr:2-oxoacid:acceptor oxidoreductase subunit alpha [Thermoanaerobaculia bacterium]
MPTQDLTIAIVGSGGDGVITAGELVAQAAARRGLHVMKTEAYGPQIRGGESSCTVRLGVEPLLAPSDTVDVLVVFGWADYQRFRSEIVPARDAIVIYESASPAAPAAEADQLFLPLPLEQLARNAAGSTASKNVVTLGILCEMFGLPTESIEAALRHKFGRKKAAVLENVVKAFEAGCRTGRELMATDERIAAKRLAFSDAEPLLMMSGNEAAAVAAVHAGCRFFAGYPITPSSEVLHFLGEWMPKVGGVVLQTEDELAAIGAVVGASFAGVKALTSTSGPGLSLMSEMITLSAMAEVPTVIINVQRGGPSTGIPTKSEQSDLMHALYGGHGDTPRVVIAPVDVADCFHATVDAFNIAEQLQMPVIVLSDQAIGQRKETLPIGAFEHKVIDRRTPTADELADYARYRDTKSGISPMATPGIPGGTYQTNGLEHDESGRPNSMHVVHEKMNAKRYRKLAELDSFADAVRRHGPKNAKIGIICWGSSQGSVVDALGRLAAKGIAASAFVPRLLSPFPAAAAREFIASVEQILVVEISFSGQFHAYLRSCIDLPAGRTHLLSRSGAKNLTAIEVEQEVTRILSPSRDSKEVYA